MTWQEPLVMLVVAAAAVYVLRRAQLALAGHTSGCGSGCGTCPSASSDKEKQPPLMAIGPPPKD
jgi:hypothetical protein